MINTISNSAGHPHANLEHIISVSIKTNHNAYMPLLKLTHVALVMCGAGLSLFGFINDKIGYTATGTAMTAIGTIYLIAGIYRKRSAA